MVSNLGLLCLMYNDRTDIHEIKSEIKRILVIFPNIYFKSVVPQSEISLMKERIIRKWDDLGLTEGLTHTISVDWVERDGNHQYNGLVQNIVYRPLTGTTT